METFKTIQLGENIFIRSEYLILYDCVQTNY